MDPELRRLASRLRQLRLARGLSQRELAGDGYTREYLSMVESGRVRPSRDLLRYLAGRLGLDLAVLTGARERYAGLCAGGEEALAAGDYGRAAELFAEAADCDVPEAAEAVCRRVTALALAGDLHRAIELGERLVAERPSARAYATLLMPYNIIGAAQRVAVTADLALAALDAPDAFVLRAVTQALIDQGRYQEAVGYARQARDLCEPGSAEAGLCGLALASARMEAGRWADAASELAGTCTLLTGTGHEKQAQSMLAEALCRMGRVAEAVEVLPDRDGLPGWLLGYAHRVAGLVLGDEAELRASVAVFTRLGARREVAESSRELGRFLAARGRPVEAAEAYLVPFSGSDGSGRDGLSSSA
ncbi:helix-turn-helix domain-containing protein [Longispora albida]|uniref:helix-turn-helix domain-containing protein n=1 Tax=Longispora albida TaxID=203523 RepID=UPI00037849CD|nr:helix-turn-helix domain-containing protein [Longispora albida]